MRFQNSPESYGAIAKLLHWLTVALVILAWLLGTFGDELPVAARDQRVSSSIFLRDWASCFFWCCASFGGLLIGLPRQK